MRSINVAVGIAAIALLSMTATAAAGTAGWTHGQSASTGNLYNPSMVEDSNGHEHIAARGDTGVWYINGPSGTYTVAFGGNRALDGVALSAEPGCVTGLIGPNGAGKSTLFDVASGLRRPSCGQVFLDGDNLIHQLLEQVTRELGRFGPQQWLEGGRGLRNLPASPRGVEVCELWPRQ